MSKQVHTLYLLLLFTLGIGTAVIVGINGFTYYSTAEETISNHKADLDARISDIDVELEMMQAGLGTLGLTREELLARKDSLRRDAAYWQEWKPTGFYGHGLGILGSASMMLGVALYSSRKRVRRMRNLGKIKHWLEFHIFLCLLGPVLVLYHTTFKFGGIVAVSAWSMIFVALSGILGRYIYTQIPKTIEGQELSMGDLAAQNDRMRTVLTRTYKVDDDTLAMIDGISHVDAAGEDPSIFASVLALVRDDLGRRSRLARLRAHLAARGLPTDAVRDVMEIARRKSLLLRRIAFLGTAQAIFHYWHVVHFPFSIIMFLILIVHVVVTVSLGYTWIF